MAGRPCKICADSEKTRIAAQMIAQGATDEAVAAAVGGVSRVSVHRHRINHIQPLVRAVADAVGKGMPVRKEREKALKAAEKGELDPATFLSMGSLTAELRKAADRIERASSEAEKGGSLTALAQLLGQAHKNIETRAKLSGIGNFGTKVAVGIGIGGKPFEPFVLRLNIGEKSQTIIAAPMDAPPFEVRYTDGREFDPRDVKTNELVFVPRGHNAPVVEHQPIEQPATAPDGGEQVDGDTDIDSLLNSVFDRPLPDVAEEVEPEPTPRRGRPRRA